MIKVIDNFLDEEEFKQLQSIVLSQGFHWQFDDCIVVPNDGQYQFTHCIFNIRYGGVSSGYYSVFDVVQQKLGVKKLDRIKLNLNPKTVFHIKGGYHIDNNPSDPYQHTKTAVFYINTNNGWTEFKKGGRVKSIANRMVIFDSNLEHTGVSCTDENRRVLVNFNYA